MILAVIPARGGSKRIPRKNIRPFCGKPIIAYSIEAARAAGLFDHVVVSTDDEEIADVARRFGAEVPFLRPRELADDHTGVVRVVRHAIEWFDKRGEPVQYACCVYATAPFITPEQIRQGLRLLQGSGKAYAISVTTFPFPIWRSVRRLPDGSLEPLFPEHIHSRSQDLEEAYHDAAQCFWGTGEAFRRELPVFGSHTLSMIVPPYRVQDIDTEADWQRAEALFRVLGLG
jgi:N-acylneuraminate cytidylyltransferase